MHSFIPTRTSCLAIVSLSVGMLSCAGCLGTQGPTYPMYDPGYAGQPSPAQGVYVNHPEYPSQPAYAAQPIYAPQAMPETTPQAYSQSDYIYYPAAEVYYSPARQQYIYREGRTWTARHERPQYLNPGQASVQVQLSDGPEHHHAEIQRKYPRTWRPQQTDRDRNERRDGDDHDRNEHRDGDER
jgi:hypothetical protein